MVLAQRAGVEEYHSADLRHDEAMQAINDFGVRSHLLGQAGKGEKEQQQYIFLVEVPEEHEEAFTERYSDRASSFKISPLPSTDSTHDLLADILQQAYPSTKDALSRLSSHTTDYPNKLAGAIRTNIYDFERKWMQTIHDGGYRNDITIIAISPSTSSEAPEPVEDLWGTYSMPRLPLHHKRQQTEQPLEEPTATTTNLGAAAASNATGPLRGILPACFPSLETCNSMTRNCTGHGSCSLKYTDSSAPDRSPAKNCYTCTCKPQEKKDSQGRVSTTYYGGPACQKRDVSVQFWLIVLFSVAMVGLVSFAVGTVWEMGDAELPSVIGAGVSGPTARR
ncbi:uncharacterized protein LTR77_003854 [Saxophila tyrrhenica]|uniref:Vacuolar sorting protein Vps3844 C-terminal domain-containing protein n=1 Tax=Saxophila tyrrhenica TaxID=1690608 RepID=A0AAV9PI94_9PEZI|nr:hypothetical protein LTR77_003854 [Saxophila tyrrhenica]